MSFFFCLLCKYFKLQKYFTYDSFTFLSKKVINSLHKFGFLTKSKNMTMIFFRGISCFEIQHLKNEQLKAYSTIWRHE